MPDIMTDLEFQERIKGFTPEGQFLAQQIYDIQNNCPICQHQITSKKKVAGISGLSGIIGGAIVFIVEYFATKGT